MTNCYLCGRNNATAPLNLKETFTAHSLAACPQSNLLCDRCDFSINIRANYYNPNKKKYSLLHGRNWSWLYHGDELIYPILKGEKDGYPIVSQLPTRERIKEWIIDPPVPPFTIAIAESGQKHILFLSHEARDRDCFPVQFETDTLIILRKSFIQKLNNVEQLLGMGATKTEILTGQYKSQFLLANLNDYQILEDRISPYRGSRVFELILYVAAAAILPTTKTSTPDPLPHPKKIDKPQQLSLF